MIPPRSLRRNWRGLPATFVLLRVPGQGVWFTTMEQGTYHVSEDPAAMARHWLELGAQRLHIVDLNGAFAGKPKNE